MPAVYKRILILTRYQNPDFPIVASTLSQFSKTFLGFSLNSSGSFLAPRCDDLTYGKEEQGLQSPSSPLPE